MKKNKHWPENQKDKNPIEQQPVSQKMDLHHAYVVNPAYKFREDYYNIIITNNNPARYNADRYRDDITYGFAWYIHPELVLLFSLFDGKQTLEEAAVQFCSQNGTEREEFLTTVKSCICNKEPVIIPANDREWTRIPKNFLIPNTDGIVRDNLIADVDVYFSQKFYDFSDIRLCIPNSMTLMLNTACVTDCVYCYAERPPIKKPLSFPRLLELLEEAHFLGMPYVDVDGGEFFLYPYWRELLEEMRKYDYMPLISTKHPLSENTVSELKDLGIRNIQLSIDSVNSSEMQQMLKVDANYLEKVLRGVRLLDEAGIEIIVKPVITRYNDSEQSLNDTIDVLTSFGNVKHIDFTPAEFSRFKPGDSYFSTRAQLARLKTIVEERNRDCAAALSFLECAEPRTVAQRVEEFPNRPFCSGNVHGFFVLPDGEATFCERMYWHPFFILGDLKRQSIMQMWNSRQALSKWHFSQEEVRDASPCKTCDEFDKCRRRQGNCWRLAIDAYGDENYDYPAPDCPKALPVPENFYIP